MYLNYEKYFWDWWRNGEHETDEINFPENHNFAHDGFIVGCKMMESRVKELEEGITQLKTDLGIMDRKCTIQQYKNGTWIQFV